MPQTVPNRPTNGAVAPIVASTPVPRATCRDIAASTRSSRSATRSLNAVVDDAAGRGSPPRAADWTSCATASLASRLCTRDRGQDVRVAFQHAKPAPGDHGLAAELDGFGEPDRPSDAAKRRRARS